jgi:hypothetical protein
MITGTLGFVIGKWLMGKAEGLKLRQFRVQRAGFSLVRQ